MRSKGNSLVRGALYLIHADLSFLRTQGPRLCRQAARSFSGHVPRRLPRIYRSFGGLRRRSTASAAARPA